MDPLSMEKAMIKNMIDKTGKSIDVKHNEIVTFFKKDFSLTHGYANLIARKSK